MVMSYCCGTFTVVSPPRRTLALHPASVTIVTNRAAPPRRTTNERRFMDSVSVAELDHGHAAATPQVCQNRAERVTRSESAEERRDQIGRTANLNATAGPKGEPHGCGEAKAGYVTSERWLAGAAGYSVVS